MKSLLLFCFFLASPWVHAGEWDDLSFNKRTTGGFYLTPEEAFKSASADNKWPVMIDIRHEFQRKEGSPKPPPLVIPFREIDPITYDSENAEKALDAAFVAAVDAAVKEKDGSFQTPLVLLCKTGKMSAIAADELMRHGYLRVYTIPEGFDGWKTKKLPQQ